MKLLQIVPYVVLDASHLAYGEKTTSVVRPRQSVLNLCAVPHADFMRIVDSTSTTWPKRFVAVKISNMKPVESQYGVSRLNY